VGVVLLSTSKVVPYHTKKLAMWHKLVSNQRIFKMCARKTGIFAYQNLHSLICVDTYSMIYLVVMYVCE
jgi:hypothetical protein